MKKLVKTSILVSLIVLTSCLVQVPTTIKPNQKVEICHKTSKGYKLLEVGPKAAESHVDHGDYLPTASGSCTIPVPPVDTVVPVAPVPPEVILPPVFVPPTLPPSVSGGGQEPTLEEEPLPVCPDSGGIPFGCLL